MQLKVPINKSKAIRLFIFFALFVILSALMATRPELFVKGERFGFVRVMGYVCTVIFVLAATVVSNKVFNQKPGLLIDDEGLTDNSLGVLFSKVGWTEIESIKSLHAAGENFITVVLKHPEAFIVNETNAVKRKMLELNYQTLRTPINIAASRLKMDFDQLYSAINNQFEKHK